MLIFQTSETHKSIWRVNLFSNLKPTRVTHDLIAVDLNSVSNEEGCLPRLEIRKGKVQSQFGTVGVSQLRGFNSRSR